MRIVRGHVALPDGTVIHSDGIELDEVRGTGRLSNWEFTLPMEAPSEALLQAEQTCRLNLDDGRSGDCFWMKMNMDSVVYKGTGPLATS